MRKQRNRILSAMAAIVIMLSLVPVDAFALEASAVVRSEAVGEAAVHTMTIHNPKTVHVEACSTVNAVIKTWDENVSITVETIGAVQGYITATYDDSRTTKGKILIEKDGVQYFYTINQGSGTVGLPLQMGDGVYTVIVYKHLEGTKYRRMTEITLQVEGLREENVYTNAIQMADYVKYQDAVDEVNQQLKNAKTDEEKVKLVYQYITANIKYDYEKVKEVMGTTDYLPNLNDTVHSGKAICYDFASLYAAVLRSNQIPAKLVMGYRSDMETYHAWNEVLLDGKWVIIDTTADSSAVQSGRKTTMIKDASIFTKTKEY